jgi:tripeptidyl-peptidase I
MLKDVSDPDSANYGKHWTIDQIHETFAPAHDTIEVVKAWLEESGFQRDDIAESTSRGLLKVDMPVHKAENLFATEYYEHEDENGDLRVACDA